MAASDKQAVIAILPDVNIVSIGGCSIMDRGKNAIVPLWTRSFAAAASIRSCSVSASGHD
jgi:hypothetical protein